MIIPQWRRAWRLLTVQLGALALAWVSLPEQTQEQVLRVLNVDERWLPGILGAAVIIARLIGQPKALSDPPAKADGDAPKL